MNNKVDRLYSPDGDGGGGATPAPGQSGGGSIITSAAPKDTGTPAAQTSSSAPPDWLASFKSPELKSNKSLARFADPEALGHAYVEAEKAISTRVAIPGEKATPEERSAFFNKVGRPEAPTGYKLPEVKLSKDLPMDEAFKMEAINKMHAEGLTQSQASALYGFYMEKKNAEWSGFQQKQATARADSLTELKKEYGDKLEGSLQLAHKAVLQFGGKPIADWLDSTGFGDSPNMIRLFVNIGKALLEPKGGDGKGDDVFSKDNQTKALTDLQAMKKDPETSKILADSQHLKHKELTGKYMELQKLAYPGKTSVD